MKAKPSNEVAKRLKVAFKALGEEGYFCAANFGCCQPHCWEELERMGVAARAVFYHAQDLDDLKRTGQVLLAWRGSAEVIIGAVEEAGLEVRWNGDKYQRILVKQRVLQ